MAITVRPVHLDTETHHRDTETHHRDTETHHRDTETHHRDTETHHRHAANDDRPALPGLLAELGDDAWEAVDLALAELADRRTMLIDALTTVNDVNLDRLVDNLRRHAHTVRSTAALLGDDVVLYAATAVEHLDPEADVALRVQRLVDAIGRMIVLWSPIEDASLTRWLSSAAVAG
jgi:hypothetical protein